MNSLFLETSAKTAVGVSEAFQSVVQKILDTPELWTTSSGTGDKSSRVNNKARPGASSNSQEMPGTINLVDGPENEEYSSGCGC